MGGFLICSHCFPLPGAENSENALVQEDICYSLGKAETIGLMAQKPTTLKTYPFVKGEVSLCLRKHKEPW